jgi:molybdate transport system regulatory protein
MSRLTLRVDFANRGKIGRGKIHLLEMVAAHGSIAAAGRALGMSYRRAWLLIDSLNQCFDQPVAAKQLGGPGGGRTVVTPFGETLIRNYRAMEKAAAAATAKHLRVLERALAKRTVKTFRLRRPLGE